MAESKMAEFKMAAIIKLSENEWMKFFFVQMVGTNLGKCEWVWEEKLRWLNQDGRIQDGCHHQFEWECMSEVSFVQMAESKMAEFKMAAIIKLSQNEWVWVRMN